MGTMHTTNGLLTTVVQLWLRLATPLAILLAITLVAFAFALTAILAVPTEPVTVAPFRWSA
jgi:hypothetical protein